VIVQLVLVQTKDFLTDSAFQGQLESDKDLSPPILLILNGARSVTTFLQRQPVTKSKAPILSGNWIKALSLKNKGYFRAAKLFS
jgi:hypothetical protein